MEKVKIFSYIRNELKEEYYGRRSYCYCNFIFMYRFFTYCGNSRTLSLIHFLWQRIRVLSVGWGSMQVVQNVTYPL